MKYFEFSLEITWFSRFGGGGFYCLVVTHHDGTDDTKPLAPSLIRASVDECDTATIILFSPAGVGIRITLFSLEHGHGMRYTERIDM